MYFISQITKNKIDNIDANNNEIIGTAMASANSEERELHQTILTLVLNVCLHAVVKIC